MSKLSDLRPHVKETLALQAIFFQLGYDQKTLAVVYAKDALGVAVIKDGVAHAFPSVPIPAGLTSEAFSAEWKNACATWNSSPKGDRHDLVEQSSVRTRAVLILSELVARDLRPPAASQLDFCCPFCGGHVRADGDDCSVLHSLPTCSKFNSMDALEFIKNCRYIAEGN